jgi:hypothetical protein
MSQETDWCDIYREGCNLYSVMFCDDGGIEENSPIEYLFEAVAAAAANGVFTAISAALGIKEKNALEIAVSNFYGTDNPNAIGFDGLKKEVEEYISSKSQNA